MNLQSLTHLPEDIGPLGPRIEPKPADPPAEQWVPLRAGYERKGNAVRCSVAWDYDLGLASAAATRTGGTTVNGEADEDDSLRRASRECLDTGDGGSSCGNRQDDPAACQPTPTTEQPSAVADPDGWIAWGGGECSPIPDGCAWAVQFRHLERGEFRYLERGELHKPGSWYHAEHRMLRWQHSPDGGGDIIAYRIEKPASEPVVPSEQDLRDAAIAAKERLIETPAAARSAVVPMLRDILEHHGATSRNTHTVPPHRRAECIAALNKLGRSL